MFKGFAIQGNAFYSTDFNQVKYLENCIIYSNEEGIIEKVHLEKDEDYLKMRYDYLKEGKLRILSENEVILPGFVDLHIHAPQWPQAGTALDRPLEVWLGEYTFPLEAKFKELEFANKVYQDVIQTTLKNGTTTGMYFATVDKDASVLLAKLCGAMGQRGYVGKVAMDEPGGSPEYYKDKDAKDSLQETQSFIKEVLAVQNMYKQKVYPVVTPRFIPTCTKEALEGLGALANQYKVHIQTHASESDWAHGFVKEKTGLNDAKALDGYGLMTSKSVVAHAPFLESEDVKILRDRKTTIAHCPLSNAYFANSVLPVKDFVKQGVNVGLATDVSGGYSPSMYQAIRQAVISSKMLQDGVDPLLDKDVRGRKDSAITLNNAFYCASVAGGIALDLQVGKFEEGYIFDAQVVNISENIPLFYEEKNAEDLLHKILLLAQTSNVKEVWIQGKKVVG